MKLGVVTALGCRFRKEKNNTERSNAYD